MKNLISYMMEQEQKTFDFKIKLANVDPSNENMDKIEHALSSFEIVSVSKPKHLPPVDTSRDFPGLGKCDVQLISVSLKYPCTDEQVRQAIVHQGRVPGGCVVVVPANQPEELQRESDDTTGKIKGEALLNDPELKTDSDAQPLVGQKRMESLKDLATRAYEIAGTEKTDDKTTNDLPQNNTSPVQGRLRK